MKILKKSLSFLLLMSLLLSLTVFPVQAASTPTLAVDGKTAVISAADGTPYIDASNRLMVPIRFVSETLGASVSWDNASQTALINGVIRVKPGESAITTPAGNLQMDTQAVMKNSRVYVPVRYISNVLGYKVSAAMKGGVLTADITTGGKLTISAAASLKDALNEIQKLYAAKHPRTTVAINYGGSGTLQQQIEQGAAVDIFFSASTTNMNTLRDKSLLDNTTLKTLLGNRLVLIAPLDTKLTLGSFSEITDSSVKRVALGEPKTVPAGQYAVDVFTKLNLLTQAQAKAVYAKDVREVLTWVESGNVDAGVVYSTDAKVSDKVKVLATASEDSHKPILYPIAMIKDSANPEAAWDYLIFLNSDAAQEIFTKYGFSTK